MNRSILSILSHPEEPIHCAQPSLKTLLYFIPIFLQCLLLHPSFSKSLVFSNTRVLLTPLNVYLALRLSIDFCFKPLEKTGLGNFVLGILGVYLACKALEWGLCGGFWEGMYWERKEKVEPDEKSTAGTGTGTEDKEVGGLERVDATWPEIFGWTIMQASSLRGLQYGWGPKKKLESPKFKPILFRLIALNLLQAITLGYLIISKDLKKTINPFELIGFPSNWITKTFAELFYTFCFGTWFATSLDVSWSTFTLLCLSLHYLHSHQILRLSNPILAFFDPKLCTPLFGRPLESDSLGFFWAKAWHQLLRRPATVCAGVPLSQLVRKMGLGKNWQRVVGLFGSFFLVGFLHEFAIHSVARPPHPSAHIYTQEFPSALAYFLLQPIGIILEPFIIPYIPRWIGGGKLWVLCFSLLTATPYRRQYVDKVRLIDQAYQSPDQWNFVSFFLPGGMIRLMETGKYMLFKTSGEF